MNYVSSTIINYFIINNDKITISTLRGKKHDIFITKDYKCLYSGTAFPNHKLDVLWFDGIVDFIKNSGGMVKKGGCRNSKVGEGQCAKDTLAYYVAKNCYKCNDGIICKDDIVFVIAAILDNIGICNNKYGYIEINNLD